VEAGGQLVALFSAARVTHADEEGGHLCDGQRLQLKQLQHFDQLEVAVARPSHHYLAFLASTEHSDEN
jgi:hypothetical protein